MSGAGDDADEIAARVEAALRARGVSDPLRRADGSLQLPGKEVIDISGTLRQWPNLPEDLRQKRCTELAVLLAEPPAQRVRQSLPAGRRPSFKVPSLLGPLAILGVGAFAAWQAFRYLAPPAARSAGPAVAASGSSEAEAERGRAARSESACSNARTRAVQGASLGPMDEEGWVVELVLLRPDSEPLSHAIAGYLSPATNDRAARVEWPSAPHLLKIDRFDASVEVSDVRLSAGSVALRGLRLDFYGPYVKAYFSEDQHGEYVGLANALADHLRASFGVLSAHCEHDAAPHLASWFLGPSVGDALSALVYFTGALGQAPALGGSASAEPGSLSAIQKAIGNVERADAAAELASFRALLAGRSKAPVSITFPFREGDLSTRAALVVARDHHLRY